MRLIDADKLIKQLDDDIEITQRFLDRGLDKGNICFELIGQLNTLKSYRAIVEDKKTAYDVDKVLKKLKNEIEEIGLYEFIDADVVIEIVRKGGIDG